jgi:hypothetical protein
MNDSTPPRIIAVGHEPPPMDSTPAPSSNGRHKASKAKGRTTGERFNTLNAFVDFSLAELGRVEIAVWLLLYRDTRDGSARTSVEDLARRAGCNRRSVLRAIRQLEQRGLLQIVYRGGFGRGPSRYRVRPFVRDK